MKGLEASLAGGKDKLSQRESTAAEPEQELTACPFSREQTEPNCSQIPAAALL